MKAIKNDTEIDGLRRAYLRDSGSFVRFLAWLEDKFSQGYEISEYEAAFRLTEYRKTNKHFIGLAREIISASGPNTALPHYSLDESTAVTIDRDAPYLIDSGGRYNDGACGIGRTCIFGRPTTDHCRAYTRALQRHIAIDSAIFTEGTTGHQLDSPFGYGVEGECGIGFLSMHEGPNSSSDNVTLVPGHVITNESGSCKLFPSMSKAAADLHSQIFLESLVSVSNQHSPCDESASNPSPTTTVGSALSNSPMYRSRPRWSRVICFPRTRSSG